jgi:hypothetical protein
MRSPCCLYVSLYVCVLPNFFVFYAVRVVSVVSKEVGNQFFPGHFVMKYADLKVSSNLCFMTGFLWFSSVPESKWRDIT